jgi:transcriptional regulator with XRE-family HTH domain
MDGEAFMQLALETLSCSQKELARRLGVSPTQISK